VHNRLTIKEGVGSMTELLLRSGLYVFAVVAALLAVWLGAGGAAVGFLIILAFICAFAGGAKEVNRVISLWKKMGPQ
jgi:hypothetical protein